MQRSLRLTLLHVNDESSYFVVLANTVSCNWLVWQVEIDFVQCDVTKLELKGETSFFNFSFFRQINESIFAY